jgi:anti-sigma B factor antagonist
LSRLLAAVGVAALQVALFRVRLLHVLRGLLLAARRFDRCRVFDYDSSLRDHPYFDKLYGSGPGCPPEPLSDEEENNVALKMTYREVNGVSVVALDGRIVLGEESNALREKVKSLIAEGKKKIVLNMDNVTFIDSAGLGTLVAAHHSVKTQGASLRLCHLGSKFQEVLQITKLLTVFDVYNTEAEAVASFSKGAGV